MSAELLILLIVVVTALAFDFTNGFHDTANSMPSSIATGALKPKVAVGLSAALNLVGAFLSVEVAATVAKGIVNLTGVGGQELLVIVFAGLVGGILWNLLTWLWGLPSSSSHALFGGLIGATIAALGMSGVEWSGVGGKIIVSAVLAPPAAALIAAVGTRSVYRTTRSVRATDRETGFRWGQVGSASLVSLARHPRRTEDDGRHLSGPGRLRQCLRRHRDAVLGEAGMRARNRIGHYCGGWRIIRTLGKGLVEIESPRGFAAESSSAAIILTSSHSGLPLSTRQTATGSILGTGLCRRGAEVRGA